MLEYFVDIEWIKGKEGVEGRLKEFLELRKGSVGVKISWREVKVLGIADVRCLFKLGF